MHSLATFNANNFFLRYKFTSAYPGDMSRGSVNAALAATTGFLPGTLGGQSPKNYIIWDPQRRDLAAQALAEPDGRLPDILCLQEIENIYAVRALNEQHLRNHYPYALVVDSHDPRNIDVGLLSRFPILTIRTHVDDVDAGGERIFSRDCLEVDLALPGGETLTLFLNHFKSKLVKKESGESEAKYKQKIRASHARRQAQAHEVARLVEERFHGRHDTALYAVVGDFNDTRYSPYLAPLMQSPRLTDVVREHHGDDGSWTYFWRSRNRVSQIDFVLASQALAARVRQAAAQPDRQPYIERGGLAYKESTSASAHVLDATLTCFEEDEVTAAPAGQPPQSKKIPFDFPRYAPIFDDWKNNISDHCPVKVWF